MLNLKGTASLMTSTDYRQRFIAEYWQTKIRYEKLKAFNNKIEASYSSDSIETPEHDCPDGMLLEQQHIMGEYLHILEVRAIIENIDLDSDLVEEHIHD